MMRFLIVILLFSSCQSGSQKERHYVDLLEDTLKLQSSQAIITESSFLDSISRKKELSIDQIRRHLNIDSGYYTGIFSQAIFTGDTVFYFSHGIKGAIIDYDDQRNCLSKILLTFTPEGKNVDNKIIARDCDRDESVGYTVLSYRLLNDSSFISSEMYVPPGEKESDQQKKENMWKINGNGVFIDITQKE